MTRISRSQRVRDLFDQAVELDRSARAALIDLEADEGVRRQVRALLEADERPNAILNASPQELASAVEVDERMRAANLVGRKIGPYNVTGIVGEGGMGTVCLAVRESIDQTVAIKLVRGALGDPGRIARFEREKRVLARLNHPYIARLMDVGVADDRTPYLVMEYVAGMTITQWCDQKHLGVRQRLSLILDLCTAVSYAHGNLVVHRDLKPSNVFVTNDGVVKLLDFGVAKLMDNDVTDPGLTRSSVRVMSPSYASPEQVLGDPITTATDVHGLGLLLYEILTGHRAYGEDATSEDGITKAVLTSDVRRPSALMADTGGGSGDLDAICLKALAKKPANRYASVDALREDILRHMDGRPVLARLPTLPYRAGKFIRRHRVSVSIGALITLMVVSAVGVAAWQARQAQAALSDAQELSAFLLRVFRSNDPAETRAADVPLGGFIDLAAAHLDEFKDRPSIQARMLATLADAFVELGDYKRAEEMARRSLDLRRALGTGHDAEVAASLGALGSARFERGDAEEASRLFRDALTLERSSLGNSDRETTATMLKLSRVLKTMGEYVEAEQLAREALGTRLQLYGKYDDGVVEATIGLGEVQWFRGVNMVQAERYFRGAVEILEQVHGRDDFRVDQGLTALASFLNGTERSAEAEKQYRRSLSLRRGMYGEGHPRVLAQMNNLATAILAQGRVAEARGVFRQVITRYDRANGGDHLMLALALRNVSATYRTEGRLDSAEVYLTRALEMRVRMEGPDVPEVAALYRDLGNLQVQRGNFGGAVASLNTARAGQARFYGARHPNTLRTSTELAQAMDKAGRRDSAEALLRSVIAAQTTALAAGHPDHVASVGALGIVLMHEGRLDEALQEADRALSMARERLSPTHPLRKLIAADIMAVYRARGNGSDADRIRREEAGVAQPSKVADPGEKRARP